MADGITYVSAYDNDVYSVVGAGTQSYKWDNRHWTRNVVTAVGGNSVEAQSVMTDLTSYEGTQSYHPTNYYYDVETFSSKQVFGRTDSASGSGSVNNNKVADSNGEATVGNTTVAGGYTIQDTIQSCNPGNANYGPKCSIIGTIYTGSYGQSGDIISGVGTGDSFSQDYSDYTTEATTFNEFKTVVLGFDKPVSFCSTSEELQGAYSSTYTTGGEVSTWSTTDYTVYYIYMYYYYFGSYTTTTVTSSSQETATLTDNWSIAQDRTFWISTVGFASGFEVTGQRSGGVLNLVTTKTLASSHSSYYHSYNYTYETYNGESIYPPKGSPPIDDPSLKTDVFAGFYQSDAVSSWDASGGHAKSRRSTITHNKNPIYYTHTAYSFTLKATHSRWSWDTSMYSWVSYENTVFAISEPVYTEKSINYYLGANTGGSTSYIYAKKDTTTAVLLKSFVSFLDVDGDTVTKSVGYISKSADTQVDYTSTYSYVTYNLPIRLVDTWRDDLSGQYVNVAGESVEPTPGQLAIGDLDAAGALGATNDEVGSTNGGRQNEYGNWARTTCEYGGYDVGVITDNVFDGGYSISRRVMPGGIIGFGGLSEGQLYTSQTVYNTIYSASSGSVWDSSVHLRMNTGAGYAVGDESCSIFPTECAGFGGQLQTTSWHPTNTAQKVSDRPRFDTVTCIAATNSSTTSTGALSFDANGQSVAYSTTSRTDLYVTYTISMTASIDSQEKYYDRHTPRYTYVVKNPYRVHDNPLCIGSVHYGQYVLCTVGDGVNQGLFTDDSKTIDIPRGLYTIGSLDTANVTGDLVTRFSHYTLDHNTIELSHDEVILLTREDVYVQVAGNQTVFNGPVLIARNDFNDRHLEHYDLPDEYVVELFTVGLKGAAVTDQNL